MEGLDNNGSNERDGRGSKSTKHSEGVPNPKTTLTVITVTPDDLEKYFPLQSGLFSTMSKAESCKVVALIYIVGNKCRLTQNQFTIFTGDGIYRRNDSLVEMYDAPFELVKLTEEVILTGALDELFSDYCNKKVRVQICPSLGIVNTQWEDSAHSFLSKRGHQVITTFEPEFAPDEHLPDLGDDDDVDPDTRAAFVLAHRQELGLEPKAAEKHIQTQEQGYGEPAYHQQQPIGASQAGYQVQCNYIDRASTETELLKSKIIDLASTAKRGTAMHFLNIGVMADELLRRGVAHDSYEVFIEEQINHLLIEGLHESGNYEANHSIGRGDLTGTEIVEKICARLQTADDITAKLESILSITKHTSNFLMSNQPYKFGDMAIATTHVPSSDEKKEGRKVVSFGDETSKKNDQKTSVLNQGKSVQWSAFKKKEY